MSSFIDSFLSVFTGPEGPHTRAAAPFEVNIPGIFGRPPTGTPWRLPSVREALGVPAILRAVTLIANSAGVLQLETYRNGVRMSERPRVAVRPNPLSTPRAFFRDTAFHMAARGEAWWWVPVRDGDGKALSLYPVPPWEVTVEENKNDRRYPIIRWRDRIMANEDMRQLTLMPDPDNPMRGAGPLQMCGAAVSVAVESQEFAANFYAEGGWPSVYLKSDYDFDDEDEPTKIKAKWVATPPNTPHVLSPGLTPGTLPINESASQGLQGRDFQTGEAARMFGIPGTLLDHAASGSSLTYQNVGDEFDKFVRSCLWPNYLEAIEQEMSDQLSRSTVAMFNLDALLRPDPKTRMEIHQIAIPLGIYDAAYARAQEGIDPGSLETSPVPESPPASLPGPIQIRAAAPVVEAGEVRCDGLRTMKGRLVKCGKLLAEVGPFVGSCPRCKKVHAAAA